MIRGMVDHMLHQVRQTELGGAKGEQVLQRFVGHSVDERLLLFFDFSPLLAHGEEVGKLAGIEKSVVSIPQIRQQAWGSRREFPIGEPAPFAADDVQQGISYRAKAAAKVAGELLGAERGNRLQNTVIGPAVVLVEQLNVVLGHERGRLRPGNLTLDRMASKALESQRMFLPEIRLASSFGRARGGYNFVEIMQLPDGEVAV